MRNVDGLERVRVSFESNERLISIIGPSRFVSCVSTTSITAAVSAQLPTGTFSELHFPATLSSITTTFGHRKNRIAITSSKAPLPVTLRATSSIRCNQIFLATRKPISTSIRATSSIGFNQISPQNPIYLPKKSSTLRETLLPAGLLQLPALYKRVTVDGGYAGSGGRGGDGGGGGGFHKSSLSGAANSEEDHSPETALPAAHRWLDGSIVSKTPCLAGGANITQAQFLELLEKVRELEAGTNPYENIELTPMSKPGGENIFAFLLSNLQFNTHRDGAITFAMKQESYKVDSKLIIFPGRGGPPTLDSFLLGGTLSLEQHNIKGPQTSIVTFATTSNLVYPLDDIAGKVECVYLFPNSTLRASFFNTTKVLSTPPTCIDRDVFKINVTEKSTPQTELMYGMTLEEIETCSMYGIARTGTQDRLLYAQANLTRNNTKFVNGATVGLKTVLQVDQGLGFCGKFRFFNRHLITVTSFIQLEEVEEGAGNRPPPVVVLHACYGRCVGDLPKHELFALGGPYSVRGYNTGDIASATKILELAAEINVPVRNGFMYAFAEHGNDLGSSKGNPSEGRGSSYGFGAKLGFFRAEYVVNHNRRSAALFCRFGDRFQG